MERIDDITGAIGAVNQKCLTLQAVADLPDAADQVTLSDPGRRENNLITFNQ
jgi:hypothetical protein